MQLNESGIPLKIGIQNPIFTFKDWKQEYLESGSHGVKCRIQGCLGLPTLVNLAVMSSNMSFVNWFATCVRQSVFLDLILHD